MATKIHPLSDVQSQHIGDDTAIWQFCVVLKNARIGRNCNICANTFIENDVVIGDNTTIKCGVQVWDGIRIGNNVFIGANVTFTNDLVPRSKHQWTRVDTTVEDGVTIGANSTVLGGHIIGRYAFIGAGSVVTKDVPANTVWFGNPATMRGYITNDGVMLDMDKKDKQGKTYDL